MRTLRVAVLDRFIWYEPGVPSTPYVFACRCPPIHIALVLIGNTNRQAIQWDVAGLGEVKNVLVTAIYVSRAINRLIVSLRQDGRFLAIPPMCRFFYSNRLDPVDDILKVEAFLTKLLCYVKWHPSIARFSSNIQE